MRSALAGTAPAEEAPPREAPSGDQKEAGVVLRCVPEAADVTVGQLISIGSSLGMQNTVFYWDYDDRFKPGTL